jgi:hypothetical protein
VGKYRKPLVEDDESAHILNSDESYTVSRYSITEISKTTIHCSS